MSNITFANGNITRTFFKCAAGAYRVTGVDAEGKPTMEQVASGAFWAGKENDTATAWKILKGISKDAIKSTITIEVLETVCIAQSLEEFFENGRRVERGANGRVKED